MEKRGKERERGKTKVEIGKKSSVLNVKEMHFFGVEEGIFMVWDPQQGCAYVWYNFPSLIRRRRRFSSSSSVLRGVNAEGVGSVENVIPLRGDFPSFCFVFLLHVYIYTFFFFLFLRSPLSLIYIPSLILCGRSEAAKEASTFSPLVGEITQTTRPRFFFFSCPPLAQKQLTQPTVTGRRQFLATPHPNTIGTTERDPERYTHKEE